MYTTTENHDEITLLFVLICIVGLLIVIAFYINVLRPFLDDRRYIIMEMQRSDGGEYQYWKRELKLLYISHIPIIGRIICKKLKKQKK